MYDSIRSKIAWKISGRLMRYWEYNKLTSFMLRIVYYLSRLITSLFNKYTLYENKPEKENLETR